MTRVANLFPFGLLIQIVIKKYGFGSVIQDWIQIHKKYWDGDASLLLSLEIRKLVIHVTLIHIILIKSSAEVLYEIVSDF